MSRGIGEFAALQEIVPEWLAVAIALFTQLGDVWFLAMVLLVMYWTTPNRHRAVATVAGLLLVGIGLVETLKAAFELPRPAEPLLDPALLPWGVQFLYELTAYSGGYGFPSGHAVNATVVYVGLAATATGSRRGRLIGACGLVGLIGLSRVVLGLHYLVDVVVGIALGAGILWIGWSVVPRIPGDSVTALFALGGAIALANVAVAGPHLLDLVLVGVAVGAIAGWEVVVLGERLTAISRPSRALWPLVRHGATAALAAGALLAILDAYPIATPVSIAALAGLIAGAVLLGPVWWRSRRFQRIVTGVRFWSRAGWRAILAGGRRLRRR